MLPIKRWISNYNHSANNNIEYLVIHDTGNYKDTAWQNANFFNSGDRQSSAHYFVDDNTIYQIVEDFNASWHCGDGHFRYGIGNHNSIGIEMCNSGGYISDSTINNTIELIKYLQNKYSISNSNVVRHYDASRKDCPHNMSANNWAKWIEFKNKLKGNNGTGYVITNYLPYTEYGINLNYTLQFFDNANCYALSYSKNIWIETQYLSNEEINKLKKLLGSWYYATRSDSKGKWIVTNYLPYGKYGVYLPGILKYLDNKRCYLKADNKQIWFETQYLNINRCNKIKNELGSWFYQIEH